MDWVCAHHIFYVTPPLPPPPSLSLSLLLPLPLLFPLPLSLPLSPSPFSLNLSLFLSPSPSVPSPLSHSLPPTLSPFLPPLCLNFCISHKHKQVSYIPSFLYLSHSLNHLLTTTHKSVTCMYIGIVAQSTGRYPPGKNLSGGVVNYCLIPHEGMYTINLRSCSVIYTV